MSSETCPRCGSPLGADAPQGLCLKCLLQQGLHSDQAAQTTPYAEGFKAPSPEELAARFPQLQILEMLGQGGMGAVYKARQIKLDRLVALKILPPHSSRDPAFTERFGREARALARLQHPNIVAVHDFGEADGLFYFLMEFVDGVNLRSLLANRRLPPEQALEIVPQVCDALQYAHQEGVVHRDIKPENILLDKKGRIKIADFGLAKLLGTEPTGPPLTQTNQVMGTPHYMAPEQIEHPQQVDHRADIYALGVVFYEMLTGELPLGKFAPPSHKVRVDVRLDEVVLRTLERDPVRRYQQISDVKTAVEAVRLPAATPPQVAPQPSLPLAVQGLALLAMSLGLFLIGLGLANTGNILWVAGLPVLASLAARIPWRPSQSLVVGFILVLGALGVVLAGFEHVKAAAQGALVLLIGGAWWFYKEVAPFFDAFTAGEPEAESAMQATGHGGGEGQAIVRLLKSWESKANIFVVPSIPGEALQTARKASAVPPDDRILGLIDLTGADTAEDNLLIGLCGIYFHGNGEGGAIAYSDFGQHVFVNHGTKIYLGQHRYLTLGGYGDDAEYCEALANFLSTLKDLVVARHGGTPEDPVRTASAAGDRVA